MLIRPLISMAGRGEGRWTVERACGASVCACVRVCVCGCSCREAKRRGRGQSKWATARRRRPRGLNPSARLLKHPPTRMEPDARPKRLQTRRMAAAGGRAAGAGSAGVGRMRPGVRLPVWARGQRASRQAGTRGPTFFSSSSSPSAAVEGLGSGSKSEAEGGAMGPSRGSSPLPLLCFCCHVNSVSGCKWVQVGAVTQSVGRSVGATVDVSAWMQIRTLPRFRYSNQPSVIGHRFFASSCCLSLSGCCSIMASARPAPVSRLPSPVEGVCARLQDCPDPPVGAPFAAWHPASAPSRVSG